MGLRLWLLWLLARLLSLRKLLRGEVRSWLRLLSNRWLLLRWLRGRRLMRIWLWSRASLVRRWSWLGLWGDTLGLMHTLRLGCRALLWGVLTRLNGSILLLLGLLCLLSLLSLLGLGLSLRLRLCGLLHCKKVLLLLLDILGLPMRHLLELLHLQIRRSHCRILHGDHVCCIQCLRSIWKRHRETSMLLWLWLWLLRRLLLLRLALLCILLKHHALSDHILVVLLHELLGVPGEILAIRWLWEQMCLWSKVRESMSLYRASWASSPRSWRHLPHHRTALRNLRARPRHARVHLLHHGAWVSIWVLTRSQCMAGRQTGMVGNAWMGSERLRHHHRWATKSPITGLHSLK